MIDTVVDIRDLDHYLEVVTADLPALIDHTASWCPPCQQMKPDLHAFADRYAGRIIVATVDSDTAGRITVREPLRTLPTLVLHDRGSIRMAIATRLFIEQLDDIFGSYLDDRDAAGDGPGTRPLWANRPARSIANDPERPLPIVVRGTDRFEMPDPTRTMIEVPEGQVVDVVLAPTENGRFDPAVFDGFERSLADRLTVMAPATSDLVPVIQSFTEVRSLQLMQCELSDDQAVALVAGMPNLAFVQFGRGGLGDGLRAALSQTAPTVVTYPVWADPAVHAARAAAGLAPLDVPSAPLPDRRLSGALAVRRDGEHLAAYVTVTLPDGWHAYGPTSTEGVPASLEVRDPDLSLVELPKFPEDGRGRLTGQFTLETQLAGEADEVAMRVRVQLCNDELCEPPQDLDLRATVRG